MSSPDENGPAPQAPRARLRILVWVIPGLLLAAWMFWRAHEGEEQITAASTGYNATARGLLGWDEQWEEDEGVPSTRRSGHRIHYPALILEAVLCSVAGLFVTGVLAVILGPRTSRQWE